jgi:hypothetical protein
MTNLFIYLFLAIYFFAIEWENNFSTANQLVPHAVTTAE